MYNNFYDSVYNSTQSVTDAAAWGTALLGLYAGIWIFSLILSLIYIISYWKTFKKANKPGWASIVPIYNMIVMIEIAKLPMWYIVLYFVPVANIYALFKVNIEIAKRFGKTSGFGVGMSLIPIIFIPLLAFSDNNYEDNASTVNTETNNTFDATNVINNNVESNNGIVNNQFNAIEPSIQSVNNNIEVATPEVVEPTVQSNVNSQPVENIEPMNNIPQYEPVANNTNEEIVTSQVETIPSSDNVNLDNQPVENIEVNVEPVMPTVPVVEENNVPNAFNSSPIMTEPVNDNTVTEILETTPNIESEQNVVSEPVVIQPITDTINNNVVSNKKFCKNCGSELPNIVSICPNCGTDNE